MSETEKNQMTAREVKQEKLVFIDGLDTALDAVNLMKQEGVEALIVKKRNEHDAFGIIVFSDIVRGVIATDRKLDEVNVYEIMSKPVVTVPAALPLRYIPRLLLKVNVGVAPVEDGGELTGIVSLKSLLMEYVVD